MVFKLSEYLELYNECARGTKFSITHWLCKAKRGGDIEAAVGEHITQVWLTSYYV